MVNIDSSPVFDSYIFGRCSQQMSFDIKPLPPKKDKTWHWMSGINCSLPKSAAQNAQAFFPVALPPNQNRESEAVKKCREINLSCFATSGSFPLQTYHQPSNFIPTGHFKLQTLYACVLSHVFPPCSDPPISCALSGRKPTVPS